MVPFFFRTEDDTWESWPALNPKTIEFARKLLHSPCAPQGMRLYPIPWNGPDGAGIQAEIDSALLALSVTVEFSPDSFWFWGHPTQVGFEHLEIDRTGRTEEDWQEAWKAVLNTTIERK